MRTIASIFLFITCTLYTSCSSDSMDTSKSNPTEEEFNNEVEEETTEVNSETNILLIIADDMGLDATPGYNIGELKPNMPTLEGFIENGIKFTNLWSAPTCAPTRATILTGKYGFRTNVTKVGDVLSTTETSLQSYIDSQTNNSYAQAVIGKWHLSSSATHPAEMGVPYYAGLLAGTPRAYDNWNFTENESTSTNNEYNTTVYTDLAIDWVSNQTKPWFLWLAYTAPHTPFHLPPLDLHSSDSLPSDEASIEANPQPYYFAMLEAMDTEMTRLLSSFDEETKENTVIIFIGDNGTSRNVAQEYSANRTKESVYEGGVNVPMIISGKNVERVAEVEDALINTADLFATIANLAGANVSSINDSVNFSHLLQGSTPIREYNYTEIGFDEGGFDYAIRNLTHKYIVFSDGSEAFYNMEDNPMEDPNLLNQNQLPLTEENEAQLTNLREQVAALRNSAQ